MKVDRYIKIMRVFAKMEDSAERDKVGDFLDKLWYSMTDEEIRTVNEKVQQ